MFGIGPTELIVIMVIALLVLGPKRLPELAAGLGKGLAEFRRATADINAELDDARRAIEEQTRDVKRTVKVERRVSRSQRSEPGPIARETEREAPDAEDEDDLEESEAAGTASADADGSTSKASA